MAWFLMIAGIAVALEAKTEFDTAVGAALLIGGAIAEAIGERP